MSGEILTEEFLAKIAGWEAMKLARAYLQTGQVLSSNWSPPLLRGVVQDGSASYRAGLVIKNDIDVENICHCRASKEWGTICAHSVSVGLHRLKPAGTAGLSTVAPQPARAGIAAGGEGSPRRGGVPSKPQSQLLRTSEAGAGERLELVLILPPNLEQAIARGKITLCVEGSAGVTSRALNALPRTNRYSLSAQDSGVLDRLEELSGGEPPAMIQLSTAQWAELLPRLVDHPRVTLGKSARVSVKSEPWSPPLEASLEPQGEIVLRMGGKLPSVIAGERTWVYAGACFQPLGLPKSLEAVLQGAVRVPRVQVPVFLSQEWPGLAAQGARSVNFSPGEFVLEPQAPRFSLHLAGGLAQLQGLLQCAYGPRIMTLGVTGPSESLWLPDPANPRRYGTRDLRAEQAALGRLLRCGFAGPDATGRYELRGQGPVLAFFAREYPRMQRDWDVTLEERLDRSMAQNLERVEPRFEVTSSGMQWFDLSVGFSTAGGEKFSASEVQRLVMSGQSHTRLRNGKFGILDTGAVEELQEVLLDCAPEQRPAEPGAAAAYRIAQTQSAFLGETLDGRGWTVAAPAEWKARLREQDPQPGAQRVCPPLGHLDSVLRPYQKDGVGWLSFLRRNQFGGILADEMGLGKTLQALAMLHSLRSGATSEKGGVRGAGLPWLVVCPTSLVFNWVNEARRFTPDLKVLALEGPTRHARFSDISKSDLVVTSYALVRRDAERYRDLEFDTVVLDEAQHIKNRQTQNAVAVKLVRCRHRLVLTGTPMENSVLDLWSIFDFLMPGYLGGSQDFRERYEIPITRHKDQAVVERLARRLRPFLLRRAKRAVAADLPEKIEQVSYCELNDEQRQLYRQVMEVSRKEIEKAVAEQGLAKSRMTILTALLRLRQICCDARLLPLDSSQPLAPSGKVELFMELLEEVIDGGHRVLVFSQFVKMLALLRERLEADGIEFCYLDGSTSDRQAVIEHFQSSAIPVFLISLKAGGVGLNLTAADTVIHFDPWWNPSVEDQATDRAHRIGQTQVVTSYKLITRETVEEKILTLQARKRELIAGVMTGEEDLAEGLTWDEIQELLL